MSSLAHLLEPISGDNPAGQDIRYGKVYDEIKEARRREHEASQEDRPDKRKEARYDQVVRVATEALAKQSKDLWLAAWLTEALTYEEGLGGLASGLELTTQLLERYWDCVYPPVEDGDLEDRVAPLLWTGNYLQPEKNSSPALAVVYVPLSASGLAWVHVKEAEVVAEARRTKDSSKAEGKKTPEQVEAAVASTPKQFYKEMLADLDVSLAHLTRLSDLCDQLFGNVGPSFTVLRRTLDEIRLYVEAILQKKLERDPDPVEKPLAAEPAGVKAVGGAAAAAAPAREAVAMGSISLETLPEATLAVIAAAEYWRRSEPTHPAPYLIVRALRWGELRAAGERLDGAAQPAPPSEVRVQLKRLASAAQWRELLDAAEQAMSADYGRAWLDPQRYAVKACEQLGYEAVARALKSELKCLLADYPDLPLSVLSDDTGTANPETTAWLIDALKWRKD
jgi:type VI secretion system protein ImpA